MDRLRIGLIGTGSIFHGWGGNSGHLHAYRNVREAQLAAVCDSNPDRLARAVAAVKDRFEEEARQQEAAGDATRAAELRADAAEVKGYADAGAMFAAAGLALVDIVAPPRAHAPLAIQALEAGLHVFCEKPMARNWLECLPVLEAVQASGRQFCCAENLMFESPWYDAKKQLDFGAVGQPLLASLSLGIREVLPIRWNPEASGGGALTDMGIHAIATAWFLCGFGLRPTRAQAVRPVGIALRMPERFVRGTLEQVAVEDDAHLLFDLECPATGSRTMVQIEASWSGQDRPGNRIVGSAGELVLGSPLKVVDPWGNAHEIPTQNPPTGYGIAEGKEPAYSGFVGMIREACRCVQEGRRPLYDAERAAEAMAVVGAGYLSELRSGEAVSLEDFKDHCLGMRQRHGDRAPDEFIRQVSEHLRRHSGRRSQ